MVAEPPGVPPDAAAIDLRAVRRHFGRAAATYDAAAVLQREVGARMAERLDVVRLAPTAILDAGAGTGEALGELAARYPQARRVALDVALPMLVAARARTGERRSLIGRLTAPFTGAAPSVGPAFVCGDIAALPFAPAAFDLVWSNLALQWVADLPRAFGDLHRVLATGGLFTFTTFGPDTLKELRAAFAPVDTRPHVGRFVDMHDIGDMLVHAGFADPVMHMECLTLTYADPLAMMRDLKAIGAVNATQGRARGMMGRERLRRVVAALDGMRRDGRIPSTFEVVYGHAWKAPPRTTAEGHAIVRFERPGRRGAP
jgi:malonyl-CoA O-methyltransferase